MIKDLFKLEELHLVFSEFKKDRIDNQYYVSMADADPVNKEKCSERLRTAQKFNMALRAYAGKMTNREMAEIRRVFGGF